MGSVAVRCAPDIEDETFWSAASVQCSRSSSELTACASELELIDISEIVPTLFLGDLSARACPLALKLLGINGLVKVSPLSSELQDGDHLPLEHFTLSPLLPVGAQLARCCEFMRRNTPVLVCSSTGTGLAALVCAAHLAVENGLSAVAALEKVEGRRGPIKIDEDDLSDIVNFCEDMRGADDEFPCTNPTCTLSNLHTPPSMAAKGGPVPERELHSASPTKSLSSKSMSSKKTWLKEYEENGWGVEGSTNPRKSRHSHRVKKKTWKANEGEAVHKPKVKRGSAAPLAGDEFCYAEKVQRCQPSVSPPNKSFTSPFQRVARASNHLGQCWWYEWDTPR